MFCSGLDIGLLGVAVMICVLITGIDCGTGTAGTMLPERGTPKASSFRSILGLGFETFGLSVWVQNMSVFSQVS